jgi:8-oxo-dGTP pyrophosphatase MutT (NUDIX family)
LALETFRRMPRRARRAVVRAGSPSYTVGAVCAIVRDGEVLLLRQRHRDGWTLPGGLLDRGEDCDAAMRRELAEELRLEVDPGLPVTTLVDPYARRVDIVYRIDAYDGIEPRPRGEALEASWVSPGVLRYDSIETMQILGRLRQAQGGRL